MKKLLFILLTVLLMLPAAMRAQNVVEIGTGTSTDTRPFYGYYANSWCEMIYPASEFESPGTITQLAWNCSAESTYSYSTVKIYLGTKSSDTYSSSSDWTPMSALTLVYDHTNVTVGSATGWQDFILDTPFEYDADENLVIVVAKTMPSWGSTYFYYTSVSNTCLSRGNDSDGSYGTTHPGSSTGTLGSIRSNVKVSITYSSGCTKPSNLVASNVDDQSATLSWMAGGTESSWDIYYTNDATDVPDETTEPTATTTDVTYQLSGLDVATTYYVYVRANCGTGDVSRWRQVTFSTSQVAAELPYTQDWENDEENAQWQFVHSTGDNKWAVGTAVNHTEEGTQSLYVSNNNGMSNAYTNNSTSHSWAYRDIDFGTNAEYVLSFDWNAKGESCCDYLKIYVGTPVAVSSSSYDAPAGATLVGTYNNQDNWQHVDATITSEHQGVQRLYLLWRNDGSIGTNPPAAIDNIELTGFDCGTPLTAVVSNVNAQSATLSWTSAGEESSWDIYYTTESTDIPNAETEPTETAYDTAYYFTDLTPLTTYYAYVRANCGGQVSNWKAASAFSTLQIAAELPYTQDWENDEENAQWQFVHSTGDNKWAVGTAVNHTEEGTQSLYVSNNNGMSNAYTISSTSTSWAYRDIDFGTYSEYVLSFDWKNEGESTSYDYLKIYVGTPVAVSSSSHAAPAEATLIGSYAKMNTWQHVEATISSDHQGVQRLYLLWWNDGSGGSNPPAAIDNIEIIGTDCGTPHSVAVTDVTADAITISFVPASENDDTWEVAILRHGDTIDENTEIITVYETTHTFEYLDANTVYDVYVRTACGSLWKTATSIHTECVAVTNLPFVDNFDDAPSSSVMPYCWTGINTYQYGSYPYTSTTYYNSAPYSLYFYASSGTYNIAVSPEFDESIAINTLQTTFMYRAGAASYYLIVGAMTDPNDASTFVAIDTVYPDANNYSTWVEREVKFSSYTGEGHYIAFKNTGSSYSSNYIDDVMIYPIPSCTRPDVVNVTATTESSVSFTWIPVGDESAWEYLCVPYGTEVDETTAEWTMAYDTIGEISDLLNNTKYTIYVRAYCSDGDQSLSRTVNFRTECGVMPFPYIENFESFASSEVVPCWTVMSGTAAASSTYSCSGSISLKLSGTTNNMVAMPQMDREISEVELSFSTRPESFLSTNTDCGSFQIGYVTDLTNTASFVAVETYNQHDFTECRTFDITFTNAPAGSYIAFRQFDCATNWYWFIDDIDVHEIPSCIKPTNLRVVSDSPTNVTLEWEAGTATAWNVAYGTGSFNPDEASNVETVYDSYIEITDITPGVMNTFYVQADCGGETSRWNGPLSLIPGIYTFDVTGTDTITGCGYTIYDNGGASSSYSNNCNYTLMIYPEEEGSYVAVSGTLTSESSYDKLYIFDGNEEVMYSGSGITIPLTISTTGPIRLRFTSDGTTVYDGFVINQTCENCVYPNMTVSSVTSDEVVLSWPEEGIEAQLAYGPAGFNVETTEDIFDVYENTYTISDLTPNTPYDVYIRTVCDYESYSLWKKVSFRTSCVATEIPFEENFDTYSNMPDCWTVLSTNTTSYPQMDVSSQNHRLKSAGNTSFATPALNADIQTLQVSFSIEREGAQSGTFEVGVMSNLADASTYEVVRVCNPDEDIVTSYTVYLNNVQAEGMGNYVVFRQVSSATNYFYWLDSVKIDLMPACVAPDFYVGTVGMEDITVSWDDAHGTQDTWEIVFGEQGVNPVNETPELISGQTSYTINGLTPNTYYDIYMRTVCVEGRSDWSAPMSIRTLNALPAAVPYSCSFDDEEENAAWTLENGTQTNKWYIGQPTGEEIPALFVSDNGTSNTYTANVSKVWAYRDVTFGDAAEFQLDMTWKGHGESSYDYLQVFIGTPVEVSAGTSSQPSGTVQLTDPRLNLEDDYTHFTYTLNSSYANTTKRIYLLWVNDVSVCNNPSATISSLNISVSNCDRPANVVATPSTHSVDVTFEAADEGDGAWEYAVVPFGSGVDEDDIVEISEPTFSVSDLDAATQYQVYVRTVCNNGGTSLWEIVSFTTECDYMSIPFTQNFDNVISGGSTYPICWSRSNTYSTSTQYPYVSSSNSNSLYFYASSSTYNLAVLPQIDVTNTSISALQIEFDMRSSYTASQVIVGVMSDPNNISTFTPIETLSVSTTDVYEHQYIPMFSYEGEGSYIALKMVGSSSSSSMYVDNVVVDYIPDCPKPFNFTLDEMTTNSVTLSWDEIGDATSWTVEYGLEGFTQGGGTTETVNEKTITISSLSNATYEFYVQADCGSEWSGPIVAHPGSFNMSVTGTDTITTCDATIYDDGGLTGKYSNSCNSYMIVYPETEGAVVSIEGTITAESSTYDYLEFYDGVGTANLIYKTNQTSSSSPLTFGPIVSSTGPITIHFKTDGSSYYDGFILNVSCATCIPVSNLVVNNVTTTSATVSWSSEGSNFNIVYGPTGFNPENAGTAVTSNTTSIDLTDLDAASNYDVYVQNNCGDGDLSAWSSKGTFTTECGVYELPFTETFTTSSLPNCWTSCSGIFGTATPVATTSGWTFTNTNVFGHVHPKLNIYGTSCKYWLVSPAIDLTTAENPVLSFNLALTAWNSSSAPSSTSADDKFIVAISTDNGASWSTDNAVIWNDGDENADHSYSQISSTGEVVSINLSQYIGQEIKIAFYGESTVSGGDNDLHIDSVMVYEGEAPVEPCDAPANVQVSNITKNSALVTWEQEPNTASSWIVSYKQSSASSWTIATANTTSYTLSNLNPETSYQVQVTAHCDNDESSEGSEIVSFTTLVDGVNSYDMSSNISIYPNPTNGQFIIRHAQGIIEEVNIYDAYGKLIATTKVDNADVTLDIRNFADGVYFARIVTNDGVITKRIVKR